MTKPDKKNDIDWCAQFMAPVFGVANLVLGLLDLAQLPRSSVGYWNIGIGLGWLVIGLVCASRWRKKKQVLERDDSKGTEVA